MALPYVRSTYTMKCDFMRYTHRRTYRIDNVNKCEMDGGQFAHELCVVVVVVMASGEIQFDNII